MVEKKVYRKYKYQGISYPFSFSLKGGIDTSTTTTRDIQHIREAVEQILKTELGERVMLPEFGGNLKNLVFEPANMATLGLLEKSLFSALRRWEPRVKIIDLSIFVEDETTVILNCFYRIPEIDLEERIIIPFEL